MCLFVCVLGGRGNQCYTILLCHKAVDTNHMKIPNKAGAFLQLSSFFLGRGVSDIAIHYFHQLEQILCKGKINAISSECNQCNVDYQFFFKKRALFKGKKNILLTTQLSIVKENPKLNQKGVSLMQWCIGPTVQFTL